MKEVLGMQRSGYQRNPFTIRPLAVQLAAQAGILKREASSVKRFLPNFAKKGERRKETDNPWVEHGRDRGIRGVARKKGKKTSRSRLRGELLASHFARVLSRTRKHFN